MKKLITIGFAAGLCIGLASAASAQSVNGSVNSNLGGFAAHTGMNGDIHSDANAKINANKHAAKGSHRSPNGLYNSTLGGTATHTGMNGKLHSSGNKALNTAK